MKALRILLGSLISLSLVIANSSYAATVTAKGTELTLDDAVFLALRYNPTIQNAEVQRVIDKFNLKLAQNQFEVQYALTSTAAQATYQEQVTSGSTSSVTHNFDITPSASLLTPTGTQITATSDNPLTFTQGQGGHNYNPSLTLAVTQPLLRGFGRDVTLAPLYTAKDNEMIARLNLKNSVITVITNVIQAYTALVQSQNALTADQKTLSDLLKTLDQTQNFIKAGKQPRTDLVQFQSQIASQQLTIQQDKITLETARFNLLNLLGLNPNAVILVPSDVTMDDKNLPTLAQSIDIALKNDTNYQTLLIQLRIAKRNLLLAIDNTRPQLNLVATQVTGGGTGGAANAGLTSLTNQQNRSTSVGLQLSVPISYGYQQAEQAVVQGRVTVKQQETSLLATRTALITSVTNAYNTFLAQKQQLAQAHLAVQLAAENLYIAQTKFKYGKMTPFEVSGIQTALLQAQLQEINVRQSYLANLALLEQTLTITLDRWHIKVRY